MVSTQHIWKEMVDKGLFDLIDRAIVNFKVLLNESPHTPRQSLKDFMVDLAKLLFGNFCSQQKAWEVFS